MNKTSFEIKKGIKSHIIQTNLYKTNMVTIIITVPLTKKNVTKNALIPFVLRRGSQKFPDQYILNKELDNMYGASFECGIDKIGDNQILKFYIDTINNDYTFDNENILEKSLEMLLDIVFNPVLENGLFKEEFLKIEKENLQRFIESKIDNKDYYAYQRCIESMYEDGFGIYKYGYIEDIEKIETETLTKYYKNLIQNSKIDIFLSGNFKESEIKQILEKNENIQKLLPREENYILNNIYTECKQKVDNIKEIVENMNVTQGKIVLGLDVLSKMEELQPICLVYNAILGEGANSMLFQNVREKASLAYSTRSKFVKQKLNIFISCGIQIENYEKTVELIKKQLDDIKNGNFEEEQIENAKAYLISGLKSAKEEQDTEIIFYIGQEISKTNLTLDEYIEKIQKVTKQDILELEKDIQINTIYFLRN